MNPTDPSVFSALLAWLLASIPQVLAAFAIIVLGFWFARAADRAFQRMSQGRLGIDPTLRGVLGSTVRYSILLLCIVAGLGQLGFQMGSILAVLATAGLAIGLALQATLSNIAAGIMLLWLRPFKVGDQIEVAPISGKVVEVGLFACEIHTMDGLYLFVPNSELWNKRLVNYSRLPSRQVAIKVKLSDADTIDAIRKWLANDLVKDLRILSEPKPDVVIDELADDKLTVIVQAWTGTTTYAAVRREMSDRLARLIHETTHAG